MSARAVIAAAAAMIALAVGSWVVLRLPSPSVRGGEGAERPATPATSPTPAPIPTSDPEPDPAPPTRPSPPLPAERAAAQELPPPTPWEDVPFTERPEELGGALARAVTDGVTDLREHLALCFAVEPAGPRSPAGPEGDPEPPALELRLEARGGEVVVADAVVDTFGPSLSLVTCARERVKGFRFPAPEAAGRRIRLGFPLQ